MAKQEKNVRRAAVSALRAWSRGHEYAESLIDKHSLKNELSTEDRALLQAIIMAVLRHRNLLDHWIGRIRDGKLDHEVRDILRVGVAQLMILKIPDHAAVYETVNCARKPARGLINAILRKTLLLRKRFYEELDEQPLPIQYSHPEWLWKRWRKQIGTQNTVALAEWNNQPADNYVRLNPLLPTEVDFAALGLEATVDDRFYKVTERLPYDLIKSGGIYVQDLATRHAVDLVAAKPGESILDACAAPGGKAAFIASQMQNEGNILCTDSNAKRLPRLEQNLRRLGVKNADIDVHDWTLAAPKKWHNKFDAILADVPCSNTGVIRRRVDVKWRLQHDQFTELRELQEAIMTNLLPCIKSGGRIIYSTCSIDPEENEEMIQWLTETYPELTCEKQIHITPFADQTDGAFAALLIKA